MSERAQSHGRVIPFPGGRRKTGTDCNFEEFLRSMRHGVWALVEASQIDKAVIEFLDLPNRDKVLEASCTPTKFIRTGRLITTVSLSGEGWGGVARYKQGDLSFRRDPDGVTMVERTSAAFKVVDIVDHYGGDGVTVIDLDHEPVVPHYRRIWQYPTFIASLIATGLVTHAELVRYTDPAELAHLPRLALEVVTDE